MRVFHIPPHSGGDQIANLDGEMGIGVGYPDEFSHGKVDDADIFVEDSHKVGSEPIVIHPGRLTWNLQITH